MDSSRMYVLAQRPPRGPALLRAVLVTALVLTFAGCVVAPVPYAVSVPSTFDRSWSAVVGAMEDQGLQIASADRGTGVVRGRRGGIDLISSVRTQADGTVRVEFTTAGATLCQIPVTGGRGAGSVRFLPVGLQPPPQPPVNPNVPVPAMSPGGLARMALLTALFGIFGLRRFRR